MRVVDGLLATPSGVFPDWHKAPADDLFELLMSAAFKARAAHETAMRGDFDPDRAAYVDYLTLITAPPEADVTTLLDWLLG